VKDISLPIMASDSEPVKKVFHESSSDDAVLEQLGYTQGMAIQFSIKSFFFTSNSRPKFANNMQNSSAVSVS
jgi:hypothetical protein